MDQQERMRWEEDRERGLRGKRTETMSTETTSPKEEQRVLGYLTVDEDGNPVGFVERGISAPSGRPLYYFLWKDSSTPSECGDLSLTPEEEMDQVCGTSPACLESLRFVAVVNFMENLCEAFGEQRTPTFIRRWSSSLTETQKEKLVAFIETFESVDTTSST